jgi:hypothetical protein
MRKVVWAFADGVIRIEGSVVMECGNGVVVEWDGYGSDMGYGDKYRTVLLYKPHIENQEFVADEIFGYSYTWEE